MAIQANVTMIALNSSIFPAVRLLELSQKHNTIHVGRASKSPTKGLRGAVDNAWFDSPVMSRDHADLSLDLKGNAVTLRDVGSMHGTYLNHHQLEKDQVTPVNSGDVVVFGAEVKRGNESYPACAFRLEYEIIEPRVSTTYSVDLSSDVEEPELDIDSDNDQERDAVSSCDDISIESASPMKRSDAIDPIDLTRDDLPIIPSPTADNDSVSLDPSRRSAFTSPQPINIEISQINAGSTRSYGFVIDSDEESDEENRSWMSGSSFPGNFGLNSVRELDYSDNGSSVHSISDIDAQNSCQGDLEDRQTLDTLAASSNIVHENSGRDLSTFEDGVSKNVSFSMVTEADHHTAKCGTVEAREGGHFGVFETIGEESRPTVKKMSTASGSGEADKHVTFTDELPEIINRTEATRNRWEPMTDIGFKRPSSPSDAAMVKLTAEPGGTKVSHEVAPQNSELWPAFPITSQSLGERTGKHDFFEAREGNKALLRDTIDAPATYPASDRDMVCSKKPMDSLPYWMQQSLDMTSAATFNASKASLLMSKSTAPARGFKIDDIIDESSSSTIKHLKRKSDGISDVEEDEVRAWGMSAGINPSEKMSNLRGLTISSTWNSTMSPIFGMETGAQALSEPRETRPAKRLRTLVNAALKAAACITVGGAGAVCLLAATAPSFA